MITKVQLHDAASRVVDKIRQDSDLGSLNFIVIVTDKEQFAKLTDLQETEQIPILMSVIRSIDPSVVSLAQPAESDSEGSEGKKEETFTTGDMGSEDAKV